MFAKRFRVDPDHFRLKDCDPAYTGDFTSESAEARLEEDIEELAKLQDRLYAFDRHALLVIFQAPDAAGKDSAIKHVMDMLRHTSTGHAPWLVIPADHTWFTPLAVANIVVDTLRELNPTYPEVSDRQRAELQRVRELPENEDE